ncbi:MAG: DinB family protein [Anaerolineae bacterium]|nr:DinB family protein [Anaerolineae bacterium]
MQEQAYDMDKILALYANGPDLLEAAVSGLDDAGLDTAPDARNWSIRQIVHHVVDGDDLWKMGIKAALGGNESAFTFEWYWAVPQDRWAEAWQYARREIAPSLALFRANRAHVLQMMYQIREGWERSIHIRWPNGEEAALSAAYIVGMQAGHAVHHIEDILSLRRTRGV